jgi:hypothetical protein
MRRRPGRRHPATGLSPDDGVPNGFASRQDAEYFVAGIDRTLRVVDDRNRFARTEDRRRVGSLFRSAREECSKRADAW